MSIKPYQLSRIEHFQNSDEVFDTPDTISIPNSPNKLASSSSTPLGNIIYNAPTISPITMAPTLSPMDAAFKSFASESGLANYKSKPSIFSETIPTPPLLGIPPQIPIMSNPASITMSPMQTTEPNPTFMSSKPVFMQTPTNTPIIESFYGSKLELLKHDYVILKCVLYALAFYILTYPKILKMTHRYLPNFDPLVMNMILFVIILIILNSQF